MAKDETKRKNPPGVIPGDKAWVPEDGFPQAVGPKILLHAPDLAEEAGQPDHEPSHYPWVHPESQPAPALCDHAREPEMQIKPNRDVTHIPWHCSLPKGHPGEHAYSFRRDRERLVGRWSDQEERVVGLDEEKA